MTPDALAACHARAFCGPDRAWRAGEFAALLQSPHVFVTGDGRGFALGRALAGEAELLTLATDPGHRRLGLARASLAAFEAEARARAAETAFLEVAADNHAACALYQAAGYALQGERRGYYPRPGAAAVAALVLVRRLTAPPG